MTRNVVLFSASFAFIALLLFLRAPELYLAPGLVAEDATILFNHYYNATDSRVVVWQQHAGYVSLIPNIVAWVLSPAPGDLAPTLYAVVALAISALALALLPFGRLFTSRIYGLAAAGTLALAPPYGAIYQANLIYSQWMILLAASLAIFWMLHEPSLKTHSFLAIFSVPLILTHPYSILFIMPLAFGAWKSRETMRKIIYIALMMVTILYATTHARASATTDSTQVVGALMMIVFDLLTLGFANSAPSASFIMASALIAASVVIHLKLAKQRPTSVGCRWDVYDGFLIYLMIACALLYLPSPRLGKYGGMIPDRYLMASRFFCLVLILRKVESYFLAVMSARAFAATAIAFSFTIRFVTPPKTEALVATPSRLDAMRRIRDAEVQVRITPNREIPVRENAEHWAINVVVRGD